MVWFVKKIPVLDNFQLIVRTKNGKVSAAEAQF
jgi:hypothetical protein